MPFIKNAQPEYFGLYNLTTDPGQRHDLAASEPSKPEAMKRSFYVLFEEIRGEGPTWEGLPKYNPKKAYHNKPKEYIRNKKGFLR